MINYLNTKELKESKEHFIDSIKRQEGFIEYLRSNWKTDDSPILDRAILNLKYYQDKLKELNN